MTNFERYKDDIIRVCTNTEEFPAVLSDKVDDCEKYKCADCLLFEKPTNNCSIGFILWLYEEYIEPIKLTHKQLAILKILETGWLARDDVSNHLYWYSDKPKRVNYHFENARAKSMCVRGIFDEFDFITFKDEPFSVEEMLKWEVAND